MGKTQPPRLGGQPIDDLNFRAALRKIAYYEKQMKSFPDDPDRYTPAQRAIADKKAKLEERYFGIPPAPPDGT